MARGNADLLTPEETDSGWESDQLERGSINLDPPQMCKDYVTKWLENTEIVSNYGNLSELSTDMSDDVTLNQDH
ncbi:hypothetical protein Q8A67_008822 [Cirrhinus molitorella]|nr:hypothetical protein Q8A67_008822 [Cirrhinus molitorella]